MLNTLRASADVTGLPGTGAEFRPETRHVACLRVCVFLALSRLFLILCALLQDHRCCMPYTPICIAKAVKNSAESEGMRRAHVSRAAGVEIGWGWSQGSGALLWPWAYTLWPSRVSGRMKLCWVCRPEILATCESKAGGL